MLRSIDSWDSEHFAFNGAESPLAAAASTIAVDNGPDGPTATIPDAHLLFTAQFSRAGADLVLQGEDGKIVAVHDYFATDARARLLSPEGAALSPDLVAALAGPLAPGQFAQAGAPQTNVQAVGRVAQVEGGATIIRNGVAMQANTGDAILKGDVLQTVTGSLGVTFNDGSTLNITANSRLVVNEFVYDPKGSQNSQLLDLVQGSLTFISGEVAHSGDMKIGTPVATMGIRGTVGGVTTANDGTVRFYVSQSATGAVILDSRGTIIANVVQDGPLIVVRPVGPLQVLAEELQKSPAQLATELAALQHIVSIKSVGDQLIQQFFQQNPTNNPNPQSTDHPHTQIPDTQIDLKPDPLADNSNNNDGYTPPVTAIVTIPPSPPTPGSPPPDPDPIIVTIPANLPPVNFGPLNAATNEDQTLTFTGQTALSVFDADTGILTVTLGATHGVLTLGGNAAGLTFAAGDGTADAAMVFSGTQAAIKIALDGLQFIPTHDYSGPASITVQTTDGVDRSSMTVAVTINPVNDAPVIGTSAAPGITYAQGTPPAAIDAAITIDDIDSQTLVRATVSITNFQNGDLLSFADQGKIHGDWNSGTGVLTLCGAASVADYEAALRSVTFSNTVSNPLLDQRTVSFQVDDGASTDHLSNTIMTTVDIVPAPQAPTLIVIRDTIVATTGSTILLGIAVFGHSLSDDLSVNISGFSDGDHLSNLFGNLTITDGHITLAPWQLLGLSLSSGSSEVENLQITAINEHNGAIATASQHLNLTFDAPPHAVNDNIITNISSGTTFALPDWVLLQNDSDADHGPNPLAITGVNLALSLNASHEGDTISVTDKTTLLDIFGKGGSFDYTVSDGLLTDSGHVHVSVQTGPQLSGTGGADILVGRASGSTINGNGGNDILIGGAGQDIMTGGNNADTFVFKPGNGADAITDFSGHAGLGQGDVIALDGFAFASFADLQSSGAIQDIHLGEGAHNTLIDLGEGNTITLEHVDPNDLVAADFAFHHAVLTG